VSARRLMTWYAGCIGILSVVFYAVPQVILQNIAWALIGLCSATAVAVGIIVNKPKRRAPWILLSLAVLTFMVGDGVYNILTEVYNDKHPFPSFPDAIYQLFYALLLTALVLLPHSRSANRDRGGVLDALTLTTGIGLLAWLFVINEWIRNDTAGVWTKITAIAYPLWDILILATGSRLISAVRRTPTVLLLTAGTAGMLVSDVIYGQAQLNRIWQVGGPSDLGWLVCYAAWGAAALHPSMVSLTEPETVWQTEVTKKRIAVLAVSSLIAPAVLFFAPAKVTGPNSHTIGVISAMVFMLGLLRLIGVVGTHRLAVARERGLREAGATLVSASGTAEVVAAVHTAVARLMPPGTDHRAAFVVNAGPPPDRGTAATELVAVRDLEPQLAAALGDYRTALVRRFVVTDQPSDESYSGALLVAARDNVLTGLRGAAEVLVSQAILALERIALSNEITRRDREEYFRTLVHHTADVILIVDDNDRVRYASPSAALVFGTDIEPGVLIGELIHPSSRDRAAQVMELARSGVTMDGATDLSVRGPSTGGIGGGSSTPSTGGAGGPKTLSGAGGPKTMGGAGPSTDPIQVEVSCRDLRADPTVRGLVLTLRNVTERRKLERELIHRAYHDSLTGLANRALFSERVQQAIGRARAAGRVAGILFIDLDDFKVINDTMGHEAGDELLVLAGQRVTTVLRANDLAARLGGDEFAALIDDAASPADVEQVAHRLTTALGRPYPLRGGHATVSASIGVATTADASEGRDLLRQADLALYVAKGAGKRQWRRYQSALHAAIVERLELRSALDKAVAEHGFTLQYQPIVALRTADTVGFEALVRWRHPTRGLIGPGQFIDVAEESGLIIQIGNQVLNAALRAAVCWREAVGVDQAPYVSVNVSARQFRAPGFVDQIRRELAAVGLPPTCLMLEITESLLLREDDQIWTDLAGLRDLGVRVAIDDFGTGYSSLSYLRHVPVDVVKIDKSFIATMSSSPQQRALVAGIVLITDNLGLKVVAEGIENAVDRDLLNSMGCPYGQGFLFSEPLTLEDTLGWLNGGSTSPAG
jgi:diguanylate cyclase (GGDEF)-like protein